VYAGLCLITRWNLLGSRHHIAGVDAEAKVAKVTSSRPS
jgi:hypothetical protein